MGLKKQNPRSPSIHSNIEVFFSGRSCTMWCSRCVVFFLLVCTWTADEVRGSGSTEADDEPVDPAGADYHAKPWVSKCCDLNYGYSFESKSVCVETPDEFLPHFEDLPDYSDAAKDVQMYERYEYFIGDPCFDGKYVLNETEYPDEPYFIYSNGTVKHLDYLYTQMEFCLETVNGSVEVFICFESGNRDNEVDFSYGLYAISLLISVPFLFSTAVIYFSIEMIRDLRGKSLACHVSCLGLGYLFLALVQLESDNLGEDFCIAAGFLIQFFFVAAFFWLNVICFDTWNFIRKDGRLVYDSRTSMSDNKKFCLCSFYAWKGSGLLSIVSLIMELQPAIPRSYVKPNFGLKSCWFYSDAAALPYYYGPVGFIIFLNVIFCILSVIKIYQKQKKSVEIMLNNERSTDETREESSFIRRCKKSRYIENVRLQECFYFFLIMGTTWAADIISWVVAGPQIIWLLTDLFNAFQGVMIFYLFVIKPDEVRLEVKKNIWKFWVKIRGCKRRSLEVKNVGCYEMSANEMFL